MKDLNRIVVIGRVTKDVGSDERSFTFLPSGIAKADFSIAVGRSLKRNNQWVDEVSFFDVQVFGKTAENLKQYLTKGKQICVEGSLVQNRWEKDGQKYSKIYILAENVQLLGGKTETTNSGTSKMNNNSYEEEFPEDSPDGIPF